MENFLNYNTLTNEIKLAIDEYSKFFESSISLEELTTLWFKKEFNNWLLTNFSPDDRMRKSVRFEVKLPIKILDVLLETEDDSKNNYSNILGEITNISKKGFYFESQFSIEEESIIKVQITLEDINPELSNITALAMVVRSQKISNGKFGIGVQLSSIYDSDNQLDYLILKEIANNFSTQTTSV